MEPLMSIRSEAELQESYLAMRHPQAFQLNGPQQQPSQPQAYHLINSPQQQPSRPQAYQLNSPQQQPQQQPTYYASPNQGSPMHADSRFHSQPDLASGFNNQLHWQWPAQPVQSPASLVHQEHRAVSSDTSFNHNSAASSPAESDLGPPDGFWDDQDYIPQIMQQDPFSNDMQEPFVNVMNLVETDFMNNAQVEPVKQSPMIDSSPLQPGQMNMMGMGDFTFHQPNPNFNSSPMFAAASSQMRTGAQNGFPPSQFPQQIPSPFPQQLPQQPYQVPVNSPGFTNLDQNQRRQSYQSGYSGDDDNKKTNKKRCPQCSKDFKDLKAHILTHSEDRPAKCAVASCPYAIKGFSRNYDRNRHQLTHYKGDFTCVWGCLGDDGEAQVFNKADAYRTHFFTVHDVKEANPQRRCRGSNGSQPATPVTADGKQQDATAGGKKQNVTLAVASAPCDRCDKLMPSVVADYKHIVECVAAVVNKQKPCDLINEKNLAEVDDDSEVDATLRKNDVPATRGSNSGDKKGGEQLAKSSSMGTNHRVQKYKAGMTHSRGGVSKPAPAKGRKNRQDYPSVWGISNPDMKQRTVASFSGSERLYKDEMRLNVRDQVRIPLANGGSVTDFDVQTLNRAEAFHKAAEVEMGPWGTEHL